LFQRLARNSGKPFGHFKTVEYSATGELLKQYLAMEIPRVFIYGRENKLLSYIPKLLQNGMNIKEISGSNHLFFTTTRKNFTM